MGIVNSVATIAAGTLVRMRETLAHRGPDDAGEWYSSCGRVGLAHRRLAIVDLSPAGRQPMLNGSGDLVIVFNGEIYNFREIRRELSARGHRFVSETDTEVILAAYREWGEDCVCRFNGMFVFAIYEARTATLLLARDRAGEKPLFYSLADGALRFASELKALLADPAVARRLDREALDCYLAMGFIPGDRCILNGVKKLPPAHAMRFDMGTGEARFWRYWQLPEFTGAGAVKEETLLGELEALLEEAVKRQLVADVPVGVLLSGGVDSSLVTAMAARHARRVKTFTIRFPGYGSFDETGHARLIARHFDTEHVELEAAQATVELLPLLARQFDEPMLDSSMVPTYLVSQLIRRHCKVALGGDGGDELFGGYCHHNRLLWLQRKLRGIPRCAGRGIARIAEVALPLGFKGRLWLQGLATDLRHGLPMTASYFDIGARKSLMATGGGSPWSAEAVWRQRVPGSADLLQRVTRMDFTNYLPEDILVKADRASMLNALEVRSPFLDCRLIEFAFGRIPSHLKATPSSRKVLLKKLCGRVLPPQFDQRRKQGFSIPLASWLQSGPWQAFFQDTLLGSSDTLFNRKAMEKLLRGQRRGLNNSERLFALVLFELWRREYRVSV